MMWQLKSASRGPLDRLRQSKVVFSFPPSAYAHLKLLVDAARRTRSGEGVFGVHSEARLAVDLASGRGNRDDDEDHVDIGDADDDAPPSPSTPGAGGSPSKITWTGPEVSWLNACVRASLAVQIAPESQEYQEDAICQEQAMLLQVRSRLENVRHSLRKAEDDAVMHDDDTPLLAIDEETPLMKLRSGVSGLEKAADRLKARMRSLDNRLVSDRQQLQRLELPGAEGQPFRDDRKEIFNALVAEVTALEGEVEPVLEELHKLFENKRHVLLQENINHLQNAIIKVKAKIKPLPKELEKGASSKEQDTHKAETTKITADNKKYNDDIAKKEKAVSALTAKLKEDLRTLEKPNPPPAYVMTLSARAFARMEPETFVRWLNWQPESNGYLPKAAGSGKGGPSQPASPMKTAKWNTLVNAPSPTKR